MVCTLLDPLFSPSQPASFEVQLQELPEGPPAKAKKLQIAVNAQAEEHAFKEQKVVTIPIIPTLCNQCRQSAGGYFEAVVQIRSSAGKLSETQADQIAEFISKRLLDSDLPSSSVKMGETRGGFDVKCMTGRLGRTLAKGLAETFGLTQKVSSKVVGRTREGKNLRRDTYSLRFPLYQVGDVIIYKESPFRITGLRNGRYILTNLSADQRETLSPKDLSELDAEFLNDEIQTFQVISVEGDVVQLMSQEDYSMFDLPRPEKELVIGSMVSAIEWNNRLVLLPKEEESVTENDTE
jgi:nonsense-mediated mRNA decay protein 3